MLGILFTLPIIAIVATIYFAYGFCTMKIFDALGVEPKWAGWIPIYGQFKLLEAGGQSGWWIFVAFVPIVGELVLFIVICIAIYNISTYLGQGGWWLAIWIFVPWAWLIYMAIQANRISATADVPKVNTYEHTAELVKQVRQEMVANEQTPPADATPGQSDNSSVTSDTTPASQPVTNATPRLRHNPYANLQQQMNSMSQPPKIILNKQQILGDKPAPGSESVNDLGTTNK